MSKFSLNDFKNVVFDGNDFICVGKDCFENGIIEVDKVKEEHDLVQFFSINALTISRASANVTKHRTFLVECDALPLEEQQGYIDGLKMPYSTKVFSGGKSYHYLIVLETPVSPDEYIKYSAWIHAIMNKADKATKDAARFSRWPGTKRKSTGVIQELLEVRERIPNREFIEWLNGYPDKEPVIDRWVRVTDEDDGGIKQPLNNWVLNVIRNPPAKGERNSTYLKCASSIRNAGYNEEECFNLIAKDALFSTDFTISELKTIVKQAFSYPRMQSAVEVDEVRDLVKRRCGVYLSDTPNDEKLKKLGIRR